MVNLQIIHELVLLNVLLKLQISCKSHDLGEIWPWPMRGRIHIVKQQTELLTHIPCVQAKHQNRIGLYIKKERV